MFGFAKTKDCENNKIHTHNKIDLKKTLIWLDFGWEHGGKTFESEESYNFEWQYNFGDKVNVFYREKLDERPIFEICRTIQPDSMMGSPVVVPKGLCEDFYNSIKECYYNFSEIGLMDDDQLYLLWMCRKRPDIMKANISDWFMPIAEFSNGNFTVKTKVIEKVSFIKRVKNKLIKIWKKINGKSGK